MIAAALLSAFLNAGDPFELGRLAVRGAGRLAFLLVIVVSVAILGSSDRARTFAAYAIAGVGIFESVFGLVAYFVGLPIRRAWSWPGDRRSWPAPSRVGSAARSARRRTSPGRS